MDVRIAPGPLEGTVTPPPSKSISHRVILAFLLAEGEGTISNLAQSQDIQATENCVATLKSGTPTGMDGLPLLDCGESGSTLRFLIPVALALRGGGCFTGRGRLMERPQTPYFDMFREKGIFWERIGDLLEVKGTLTPGVYRLPGNVSSQFVTGLLYALPLLEGDSEIVLTSPLESRDYAVMTLDVLEKFGVHVENRDFKCFLVPGNQKFKARDMAIEADWSQAAFWYAAQGIGNDIMVSGMNENSTQGDRAIARWSKLLRGPVDLDISGCPDLAPPLAALGALMDGTLYLRNAARLRIKESDRLAAITQTLAALGADVTEGPDSLTIVGRPSLPGGVTVDSCNDHRIAMMAAIAATRCTGPVTILGAEAVNKSYPGFWDDYRMLGGNFRVL